MWTHALTKREDIAGGKAPYASGKGGLKAELLTADGFLRFSHKKLVSAPFPIEEGHINVCSEFSHYYVIITVVSDNTKYFSKIPIVHV